MIWNWLTERRRNQLTEQPFPNSWRAIVERNVGYWRLLDESERTQLQSLVQVFVAEKHWEGCGGLELDDEIRVTVAAEACILLLGLDHGMYSEVESILVYPTTVVRPTRPPPVFGRSWDPAPHDAALLGEAHHGGPVILAWDSVKRGARDVNDGRNLVFHEFAHKIDMIDGDADGTPPLESRGQRKAWAEICSEAFLALKRDTERGRREVLDAYGATNEAEFFAVATEAFFERPLALRSERAELYELLKDFYRQDPAERVERAR